VTRVSFQLATAANIAVKNLVTALLGVEKVVERDVSKNAMGRTSLCKMMRQASLLMSST
jgi:hypothetical protein